MLADRARAARTACCDVTAFSAPRPWFTMKCLTNIHSPHSLARRRQSSDKHRPHLWDFDTRHPILGGFEIIPPTRFLAGVLSSVPFVERHGPVLGPITMLAWPAVVVGTLAVVSAVTGLMKLLDGPLFAWFNHARTPFNTSMFFFMFASLLGAATYYIALARCDGCKRPLFLSWPEDVAEQDESEEPRCVTAEETEVTAEGGDDSRKADDGEEESSSSD